MVWTCDEKREREGEHYIRRRVMEMKVQWRGNRGRSNRRWLDSVNGLYQSREWTSGSARHTTEPHGLRRMPPHIQPHIVLAWHAETLRFHNVDIYERIIQPGYAFYAYYRVIML